jgi:hypothetical protein
VKATPVPTLSSLPWWTAADAAELDALAFEFTRAVFIHRERCDTCGAGGPWCHILRAAFDAVLEWRDSRRRLSRAAWLRARQDAVDWLHNAQVAA